MQVGEGHKRIQDLQKVKVSVLLHTLYWSTFTGLFPSCGDSLGSCWASLGRVQWHYPNSSHSASVWWERREAAHCYSHLQMRNRRQTQRVACPRPKSVRGWEGHKGGQLLWVNDTASYQVLKSNCHGRNGRHLRASLPKLWQGTQQWICMFEKWKHLWLSVWHLYAMKKHEDIQGANFIAWRSNFFHRILVYSPGWHQTLVWAFWVLGLWACTTTLGYRVVARTIYFPLHAF